MTNFLNYIHKSPHRNLLENYLNEFLPKLDGNILDVGSKNRRYDYLLKQKPVAVDIVGNKEKEVEYGDINSLNFGPETFNSILCLETFCYVTNPERAISEIYRVLKKGGTLIFSVPFMSKLHQDKMRFTKSYLEEKIFTSFSLVKIYPVGNFYTIILDILRNKIIYIKFSFFRYLMYLPYLFLVLLIPFSKISKDENHISGYFIMAKK